MIEALPAAFLALIILRGGVGVTGEPVLTKISGPAELAEGPHWHAEEKALYYVDIASKKLHKYDPATKRECTLQFDKSVSIVIPVKGEKNKFIITQGLDIVELTWLYETGVHFLKPIASVTDLEHVGNRLNDGKADAKGRIFTGTISYKDPTTGNEDGLGTLYRLEDTPGKPCRAKAVVAPVTMSNGLTWSKDNKLLYFIDTPARKIFEYDYDLATGSLSKERVAFEFGGVKGAPDGMTIDSNGNLWVACWGGFQVIQLDPRKGKVLQKIEFPASGITSVVFGGDKMDILYVTSERALLTDEEKKNQPLAGSVWAVTNLGVTGAQAHSAVINCQC